MGCSEASPLLAAMAVVVEFRSAVRNRLDTYPDYHLPQEPPMPDSTERVVVVGVGLIGGSIALAARRRNLPTTVLGVTRSQAGSQRAIEAGVVEQATTDLAAAVSQADIVIACTPVAAVPSTLVAAAQICPAGALLTDAGSTKQGIVADVESQLASFPSAPSFVGSHPLAGDHRTGPESARADLLERRAVVVTPTEQTPPKALDRVSAFWESLGARVHPMTPAAHDAAVAQTSHLPHVVAAALAAATPADVLPLAASGWRDTSRVAAGSPSLWRDILMANREPVIKAVDAIDERMREFRQALASGDGDRIEQLLEQGRQRRDAVGD